MLDDLGIASDREVEIYHMGRLPRVFTITAGGFTSPGKFCQVPMQRSRFARTFGNPTCMHRPIASNSDLLRMYNRFDKHLQDCP